LLVERGEIGVGLKLLRTAFAHCVFMTSGCHVARPEPLRPGGSSQRRSSSATQVPDPRLCPVKASHQNPHLTPGDIRSFPVRARQNLSCSAKTHPKCAILNSDLIWRRRFSRSCFWRTSSGLRGRSATSFHHSRVSVVPAPYRLAGAGCRTLAAGGGQEGAGSGIRARRCGEFTAGTIMSAANTQSCPAVLPEPDDPGPTSTRELVTIRDHSRSTQQPYQASQRPLSSTRGPHQIPHKRAIRNFCTPVHLWMTSPT
jgi:hypothetical protein